MVKPSAKLHKGPKLLKEKDDVAAHEDRVIENAASGRQFALPANVKNIFAINNHLGATLGATLYLKVSKSV